MDQKHFFIFLFIFPVALAEVRYDGHKVYRLYPKSSQHLQVLRDYLESKPDLDVWREATHATEPVDIQIPPHHEAHFREHFRLHNIPHKAFIHDVQGKIDRLRRSQSRTDVFEDYMRYEQIMSWVETKAASCSDRCSLLNIGQSTEGRDLKIIKIGKPGQGKEKLWIDAGIHAREWISPATAMYIIERLISDYDTDEDVKALVDTYDWYILPIINPDGYEYTWTTDRLWRKTRSINSTTGCIGVDANRNFDFKWMNDIRAVDPCSNTYAGWKPFSEPESRLVSDFILSLNRTGPLRLYLTLHSYSQLWMAPWGWTKSLPDNFFNLMKAGEVAVSSLTSVHGTKYTLGPASSILYQSSGTSRDWAYGVPKIEYVYTVELRDKGVHGFVLPPDQIKPCGEEAWKGLKDMVMFIKDGATADDSNY